MDISIVGSRGDVQLGVPVQACVGYVPLRFICSLMVCFSQIYRNGKDCGQIGGRMSDNLKV